MTNDERLRDELIKNALFRMDESSRMILKSVEELNEKEVWLKPNESSNSIGNLILHLCGNITQYIISSIGNIADNRERDLEFTTVSGFNKSELLAQLFETVGNAKNTIQNTSVIELLKIREVQGFKFSGIGIIIHVVEHYSYHTGQIAFWVKQLKNKDLNFYEGIDLTIKNKV